MLNTPFDISNDVLSVSPVPLASVYVGEWPTKKLFWGIILPTTLLACTLVLFNVTYQGPRFWLKAVAPVNIKFMLFTLDTSHADMSWLKAVALWNMLRMMVTFDVSHADMSWLKA